MEKNQNDKSSQQTGSKSIQQTTQDSNKKETNPGNPTSSNVAPVNSQQGNRQPKNETSNEGKVKTAIPDVEENEEEETNDEKHGVIRKTEDIVFRKNVRESEKQKMKKGIL